MAPADVHRRAVPEHLWQATYARLARCSLTAASAATIAGVASLVTSIMNWSWPDCSGTIEIVQTALVVVFALVALVAVIRGSFVLRKLHALMLMYHGRPEDTQAELEALIADTRKPT